MSLWILRFSIDLYINLVNGGGGGAIPLPQCYIHCVVAIAAAAVSIVVAIAFFLVCFVLFCFILFNNIMSVIYLFVYNTGFDHFTHCKHFYC